MDIVITTSDPEAVDTAEIQAAVEGLGYFVASVTIDADCFPTLPEPDACKADECRGHLTADRTVTYC